MSSLVVKAKDGKEMGSSKNTAAARSLPCGRFHHGPRGSLQVRSPLGPGPWTRATEAGSLDISQQWSKQNFPAEDLQVHRREAAAWGGQGRARLSPRLPSPTILKCAGMCKVREGRVCQRPPATHLGLGGCCYGAETAWWIPVRQPSLLAEFSIFSRVSGIETT